jgi:glutamine synthetase
MMIAIIRYGLIPCDIGDNNMKLTEIFGINVFNRQVMKEKLPKEIYENLLETIENGAVLDITIAETVAQAMKEWAIDKGTTHYTHWFQPLSRGTAEKHDSFLSPESLKYGGAILKFTKNELIQAEPDASSFPSGGMRSTFEARGYTVWDPTSPVFIIENGDSKTLCIPSIFTSYNGDALDKKTPLMRSVRALDTSTRKLLKLLRTETIRVYPTLGAEQEYFLIYKDYYDLRPDLRLTGRTLIGRESPRGQKLEDHYFGTIRTDVLNFMVELEKEAFKIGIPITTRHNEVAPCQFELAPIYEHVNVANDKNKILMEMMPRIARKHGFEIILHEKPFKAINGSGKHNNWSLMTTEGRNLFDIGETYDEQLQFLLFITIVLKGVHKRGELLRAAVSTLGNDFRLGANEAPPGIISVFLGKTITEILERISTGDHKGKITENKFISLGLDQLPLVLRDNTDRNRTSPFAFTGNKFEFRAVGSSQSLGFPNAFINTIVAESMDEVAIILDRNLNGDLPNAILDTIKDVYNDVRDIVFNGNNYGEDWITEAEIRKLPNLATSYDALQVITKETHISLFEKYNVLTKKELGARYSIDMDHLSSLQEIEANTLIYMIDNGIIPAVLRYFSQSGLFDERLRIDTIVSIRDGLTSLFNKMKIATDELREMLVEFQGMNNKDAAKFGSYDMRNKMEEVREYSDALEGHIPEDVWPYPTYIDILHSVH